MAKRKSAGFTLMEVLVALVVLGLLLAGLTQGTRFGAMAWRRQSETVAERDQLDAVDRTLRQLLSGAMLRDSTEPNQLVFSGQLPEAAALANRRADMILLVDENHQLILRWAPRRHERLLGPSPPPTETRLLSGVERIEVLYWHKRDDSAAAGWREDGADAASTQLVKLSLIFSENDKRRWPAIILRSLPSGPSG